MLDVLPLLMVAVLVGVASLALRRRPTGATHGSGARFTTAELVAVGLRDPRGGFVVFTAAACSACGPARAVVENVAARYGLGVVIADAAEHSALVRDHRVLRAPTTFLVGRGGQVIGRMSGVPRAADLDGLLTTPAAVDTAA